MSSQKIRTLPMFDTLYQMINNLLTSSHDSSFKNMPASAWLLYLAYLIKIDFFPNLASTVIRGGNKKIENFLRNPDFLWFTEDEELANHTTFSPEEIATTKRQVIQYIILEILALKLAEQRDNLKDIASALDKFIFEHQTEVEKKLQSESSQKLLSSLLSNNATFALTTEPPSIASALTNFLQISRFGLTVFSSFLLSFRLIDHFLTGENNSETTNLEPTYHKHSDITLILWLLSASVLYPLYATLTNGLPKPSQPHTISWQDFVLELKMDAELQNLCTPNTGLDSIWFEKSHLAAPPKAPSLLRNAVIAEINRLKIDLNSQEFLTLIVGLLELEEKHGVPHFDGIENLYTLPFDYLEKPEENWLGNDSERTQDYNKLIYLYMLLAFVEAALEILPELSAYPNKQALKSKLQQKENTLKSAIASIESKPLDMKKEYTEQSMVIKTIIAMLVFIVSVLAVAYHQVKNFDFKKPDLEESLSLHDFLLWWLKLIIIPTIVGAMGGAATLFSLHKAEQLIFPPFPKTQKYLSLQEFFGKIPAATKALLPPEEGKQEEEEKDVTHKLKTH